MTDDALRWQALRQGSREAFEWIFNAYYGGLVRYGAKLTPEPDLVEDGIQELFLKLWQRKERLPVVVSIRAYLFKALKLALIDGHRERTRQRGLRAFLPGEPLEFSYEDELIERQTDDRFRLQLQTALGKLTKRQREVLYLKYQNGMTYEEISAVMGISNQATRNLLYQALKFLRECVSWVMLYWIFDLGTLSCD